MTIHRIGPARDAVPQYRVSLGRLLVTIDDLDSLMMFLARNEVDPTKPITVRFNAGYFTEAKDLSRIVGAEKKYLILQNAKVLVTLSPWDAEAVGDIQEAEAVRVLWGKDLKTERLPPRMRSDCVTSIVLAIVFLVLGVVSYGMSLWYLSIYYYFHGAILFAQVMRSLTIMAPVMSGYIWYRWRQRLKNSNYAIIGPYTHEEYRQKQLSQKYPRRSLTVNIISATIAAIAIVAAVWVGLAK